ncbi:hypothetical protein M0R89_17080 [Halorussus limi]|uniref:Uncharacterized protein n=1 Tax=Halorussus limi TaxID=2938695 RepID=A0A8U0HTK5_9EURY|nr:hypothetical protein [Halorussus limi]UPV74238.1 hypothetical protein M0R89_17080 [Halorussus limi]
MPSLQTRRDFLATASLAVAGTAGCVGGGKDESDDTKRDFLVLSNALDAERVVSVVVTQDAERVRSGRYRVPTATALHLEDGFAWGTYEVHGKLHHEDAAYEQWQSWTWEPRSCAASDHTNDDGYWTGTLRVEDPLLEFSHDECPTEFGGFGGGKRRPKAVGDNRIGDVTDAPPTGTTTGE